MDPVGAALANFFSRVGAFAGLFWDTLSDRARAFWARVRALFELFFDELLARTEGAGSSLSRFFDTTSEVWPIFFDLLWQDLRAFDEQLREWSIPFFDFLWQTLDGLWPGFAQVWDNIVTTFQSGEAAAYTSAAIKDCDRPLFSWCGARRGGAQPRFADEPAADDGGAPSRVLQRYRAVRHLGAARPKRPARRATRCGGHPDGGDRLRVADFGV
ncbi:MAG: hypothetical protein U5L04_08035 [Trueperaceae bacterium]|nr:hypothetical protein [Trueperaceae bacterium]